MASRNQKGIVDACEDDAVDPPCCVAGVGKAADGLRGGYVPEENGAVAA